MVDGEPKSNNYFSPALSDPVCSHSIQACTHSTMLPPSQRCHCVLPDPLFAATRYMPAPIHPCCPPPRCHCVLPDPLFAATRNRPAPVHLCCPPSQRCHCVLPDPLFAATQYRPALIYAAPLPARPLCIVLPDPLFAATRYRPAPIHLRPSHSAASTSWLLTQSFLAEPSTV